jgi:hydrogenase expression/formation protein HypE
MPESFDLNCPVPFSDSDRVLMSHGGGGSMSHRLLHDLFIKILGNPYLNKEHDGAILEVEGVRLAFSTDSYVIDPVFFPGGNIGELAVNGTVNDLACCGAIPLYLSLGLIIEEGFPMEDLSRITKSIREAADKAGVLVVTGDTKVVGKGKGDKIFINTSGIGKVLEGVNISPDTARPGDVVLLSGTLADHGVAIMAARNSLDFQTSVRSDTASLNHMIQKILETSKTVHVLRDPTRGGLASTLNEIARASETGIVIDETSVPVREEVNGLCEILGLDPMYIANEGKLVVILPEEDAARVLEVMKSFPEGKDAALIGRVTPEHPRLVRLKTPLGTSRVLDMISGEQLPRIC